MDLLQIALVFLILLLSIFLSITGIQVFFILRDLKKALDKLNNVLQTGENIASEIKKPIAAASNFVITPKPKPKRFYKKVL